MASWRQVIEDALLEIGVLAQGEPAEDGQLAHGGRELQRMLAQWAGDGLLVPGNTRLQHEVTKSDQFWSLWSETADGEDAPDIVGGPFEQIDVLHYRYQGEIDGYPLVETSLIVWSAEQTITGFRPSLFWFDRTAQPYQRIRFDRRTLPGDTITIEGRTVFASVPDDLEMESGLQPVYDDAIKNNLALNLAPANGVAPVSPVLVQKAMMGKRVLMKRNIGDPDAILEIALRTRDTVDLRSGGRFGYRYR